MSLHARAALAALPLVVALTYGAGTAHADDSCFFSKADVMGELVPQAAETAWLTGDSAEKASKALPGDFANATSPVIELVGLVNSQGGVFALGFDQSGCAFVGDDLTLDAFNTALKAGGHDPLAPPPKRPMQA